MRSETLIGAAASLILGLASSARMQERSWDWDWQMHPIWSVVAAVAAALVLLTVFGWALLHIAPLVLGIIAAVLGIRWLVRNTSASRSDSAVAILRERYARGEISKEEFDAKRRDLGGTP